MRNPRLALVATLLVADADAAWLRFAKKRSQYAGALNTIARYFDVPPAEWIGDRSYVRHEPRSGVIGRG